jgi:hypothetical protein
MMFRTIKELLIDLPVEDEDAALEDIAQRLVRQGVGSAAIVLFESLKPVSFLGGQAAIMTTPFLGGFIEPRRLERYATLFGNRAFLERLIQRIEALEAAHEGTAPAKGESSRKRKRRGTGDSEQGTGDSEQGTGDK